MIITPRVSDGCNSFTIVIIDREAREIMYLVASARPSVCPFGCPSVCALTAEPFDTAKQTDIYSFHCKYTPCIGVCLQCALRGNAGTLQFDLGHHRQ